MSEPSETHAPRPEEEPSTGTSRRTFLKILGLSGAGATAAACRPAPPHIDQKLIPYLVQPEGITPGTNTTYASLLAEAGPEPLGIHAWVRDGRVLNLEGNPDFPLNADGMSALGLSTLQDLYDPDRVPGPRKKGGGDFQEAAWKDGIQALGKAVQDGDVVLLTGTGTGTRDRFAEEWAKAVGARHVRYDTFDYAPLRRAHEIAFGRAEIPTYAVDQADRIVSFGADFLATWLEPTALGRRFAHARDIEKGRHARFTFVGPRLSLTGSNADDWLPARPGTSGLVALAVAHVVAQKKGGSRGLELQGVLATYTPEWAADKTGVAADRIQKLGEEIAAAERPVALPPGPESQGADATDACLAVALLNHVAGAIGTTVQFGVGPQRGQGATLAEMKSLAGDMKNGKVRTLIVAGPNPAFTLPASAGFAEALGQVPTVVSLNSHLDETTAAASWILPGSHELESWGDAEVLPGAWALGQPVMQPVFDTRQREDILLQAAAAAGIKADFGAQDFAGYLENAWREKHRASGSSQRFDEWWFDTRRQGGRWEGAPGKPTSVGLSRAVTSHAFSGGAGAPARGKFDLVVYPGSYLYDGRGANRGWMQEIPDPITKCVWGSWVEMHPDTARPLGLENGDEVEVTSESGKVRAPVYLYPGIRKDAVGIQIGQGHTHYGRNAAGRGVSPLDLLPDTVDGATGSLAYAGVAVQLSATGQKAKMVKLQGSDLDYGREVSEIMGVEEARKAIGEHQVDLSELVEAAWDSDPMSPYRWGMTVDLNACTGCGACVAGCYAENNLAVVGEERCADGREMSWIRIERYFEATADGGFQTTHLAEMCQQCGDAPCEPVCPVYAAYHNPEGLNVQVYNRCVGTRYCSNNCPYKQRRFNWFTYDFPYPLNLQLNPDVTVREKGIMEKCTFCVQRIDRAKVQAKEKGRLVQEGDFQTACQAACPTHAIWFGNLKDPTSRVSRIAKGARSYHVLEELNTRPAVTYLRDVTHAELAQET
jgi:molybdopterin-containing oxidoreductase family iron-sulfur binding subunit